MIKKKRLSRTAKVKLGIFASVSALLTAYFIIAYSLTGTAVPTAELFDGRATFRFIDVGQGDAALIVHGGEAVLIDSGTAEAALATAEYVKLYAPHVDYFVITHPHEDHMGGAVRILERVDVDNLVLSRAVTDELYYTEAIRVAKERGVRITVVDGSFSARGSRISLEVLDTWGITPSDDGDEPDNSSLAVRVTAGGKVFLSLGDAEDEQESFYVEHHADFLDCDYLKVSHHGSTTSTSEKFLYAATPEICVVSCGKGNSYGHPTRSVTDRIHKLGAVLYRTDEEGDIILRGETAG